MGYAFHIWRSSANSQYFWHLTAGNNEKVATSAETYVRKSDCEAGLDLFKRQALTAPVNDLTTGITRRIATYEFELYRDKRGEYLWRFQAGNNRIIADSGEGYVRKQGCNDAIARVKSNVGAAPVIDHTKMASFI